MRRCWGVGHGRPGGGTEEEVCVNEESLAAGFTVYGEGDWGRGVRDVGFVGG